MPITNILPKKQNQLPVTPAQKRKSRKNKDVQQGGFDQQGR